MTSLLRSPFSVTLNPPALSQESLAIWGSPLHPCLSFLDKEMVKCLEGFILARWSKHPKAKRANRLWQEIIKPMHKVVSHFKAWYRVFFHRPPTGVIANRVKVRNWSYRHCQVFKWLLPPISPYNAKLQMAISKKWKAFSHRFGTFVENFSTFALDNNDGIWEKQRNYGSLWS